MQTGPEPFLAAVILVLLGARIYLAYEFSVAVVIGIALVPVWWRHVRRFAGADLLLLGIAAGVLMGVWLSEYSGADHLVLGRQRILDLAAVVSLAVGVAMVLWARTMLSDHMVAALFGVGLLLAIRVNEGFLISPWKFGFDRPVSLIVLAVVCASRNRLLPPVALLVLATVGGLSGARSRTAILLVALMLVMWQLLPRPRSIRAATGRALATVAVLGFAVYQFGQAILTEGVLGESAKERTEEQIAQSGSLILGGRPEMAAAWAVMRERFEGFGFGVNVNQFDLDVAKRGMIGIGYDPENGYVNRFMFGSGVELHSGIGDLWAHMGPVGLAVGLALLTLIVLRISRLLAQRQANAVVLVLGLTMLWDLAFSPLKTSLPMLVIGVGLLLRRRSDGDLDPASRTDPAPRRPT